MYNHEGVHFQPMSVPRMVLFKEEFVLSMSLAVTSSEKVRTTVRLPRPLYDEARRFIEKEETANDFFVAAICAYVKLLRRKQIDAAFSRMAEDAKYQADAKLIEEEFNQSDWDAFELGEKDPAEV